MKDALNHGKNFEPKASQGGGICRCNEVETEMIYLCIRKKNCNTTVLNLAYSVFQMNLLLRITVRPYSK